MDMHLSFIVDQTQKYSTWLMQGLNANITTPSDNCSISTASREGWLSDLIEM